MTRPRYLLWDWNGTLLDDADACVDAINVLLRRRGLPVLSREQYVALFDFPVRRYYATLGFDLAREEWNAITVEYHDAYAVRAARTPLRPGVPALLERLALAGFRHAILSASERRLLARMVEERGIARWFDRLSARDDFHAESKVDQGRCLLQALGVPAAEALLIGDTRHDAEVAGALGCGCLLLAGGHSDRARLDRCGWPVLETLDDVATWLLR